MIQTTIERSKWSRGALLRNALLIDEDTRAEVENSDYPKTDRNLPTVGHKCCLGFGCTALGVKDENMAGLGMPHDLRGLSRDLVKKAMLRRDSYVGDPDEANFVSQPWVRDAQDVNDCTLGALLVLDSFQGHGTKFTSIDTEADREEVITKLFAIGGFEVKFVD